MGVTAVSEPKRGFDLATRLGVSKLDTGGPGREQIDYLSLDNISPDPDNFYRVEEDSVRDLAANIQLVGLQQPLRVRPNPERPGHYIVVSGHRRLAALRILDQEESTGDWQQVPCIVTDNVDSPAMRELRLIYANSATRVLSPYETSQQAERVTALLYQLQQEGVEFPGRMRDHVAEACRISASKLARLNVINRGLAEPLLVSMWQDGILHEFGAYALARLPAILQATIVDQMRLYGKDLPEGYILDRFASRPDLERFVSGFDPCPASDDTCGDGCTGAACKVRQTLFTPYGVDCPADMCCLQCHCLRFCNHPCHHGMERQKQTRQAYAAEQRKAAAQERARAKTARENMAAVRKALWTNIVAATGPDGPSSDQIVQICDMSGYDPLAVHGHLHALQYPGHVMRHEWTEDIPISLLGPLCRVLGLSADRLLGLGNQTSCEEVGANDPQDA